MKTISELQIEQYGKEIVWESYRYNIFEYITDKNFWTYFNIDYKQCKTKELLSLLQTLRVYESRCGNVNRWLKTCNAIKNELSNREHMPNKKERKEIRKERAKNKQ